MMYVSPIGCLSDHRRKTQKGISLFVVVSALLILSVLTISITAQLMAPIFAAVTATNQIARKNSFRSTLHVLNPIIKRASISNPSSQAGLPKLDGTPYEILVDGHPHSLILQDVNGLIDVNSASQSLLATFLTGLGKEAYLEAILQGRANAPFKSIEATAQILAIGDIRALQRLLTVNSGRRRINSQTAPIELLRILTQQQGTREQLILQIDRRFFRIRPITDVLVFRN